MNEYYQETSDGNNTLRTTGSSWTQNWDGWQRLVATAQNMGDDFIGVTYGPAGDTQAMLYGKASFLLDWNGGGGAFMYHANDNSDPTDSAWTTQHRPAQRRQATGRRRLDAHLQRRDRTRQPEPLNHPDLRAPRQLPHLGGRHRHLGDPRADQRAHPPVCFLGSPRLSGGCPPARRGQGLRLRLLLPRLLVRLSDHGEDEVGLIVPAERRHRAGALADKRVKQRAQRRAHLFAQLGLERLDLFELRDRLRPRALRLLLEPLGTCARLLQDQLALFPRRLAQLEGCAMRDRKDGGCKRVGFPPHLLLERGVHGLKGRGRLRRQHLGEDGDLGARGGLRLARLRLLAARGRLSLELFERVPEVSVLELELLVVARDPQQHVFDVAFLQAAHHRAWQLHVDFVLSDPQASDRLSPLLQATSLPAPISHAPRAVQGGRETPKLGAREQPPGLARLPMRSAVRARRAGSRLPLACGSLLRPKRARKGCETSSTTRVGPPRVDPAIHQRSGEDAEPDLRDAEQREPLTPPSLPAGSAAGGEFDHLVSRGEKTVEQLLGEIRALQGDAAKTDPLRAPEASRRSPDEVVGEVLMTAHHAAESMIDKARREAESLLSQARSDTLPILTDARRTLEEAGRLHDDARALVERARGEADDVLSAARAERERLLADSVGEAAQRRAELEVENMRLETAIKSIRTEWAGRAAEALARLDGIGLESGPGPAASPSPPSQADSSGTTEESQVVDDLRSQLPGSTSGPPSTAPDRLA